MGPYVRPHIFKCSFCGRKHSDHMLTPKTTCKCGSYILQQVQDPTLPEASDQISERVEGVHKYLLQQFQFAEIGSYVYPAVEALEYIEAGWPEACVTIPAWSTSRPIASWEDDKGQRRIEAKDLITALRITRFLRTANV